MLKPFFIWNLCLALLLVTCTAPATRTPQFVETSKAPLAASETSQPQPTLPLPTTVTRPEGKSTEMPIPKPSLAETFAPAPTPPPNVPPIEPTIEAKNREGALLVLAFINAYNAGQLGAALALLHDNSQVGDCDFRANSNILFTGKSDVADWLRQRIADHDQLIVYRIMGGDPSSPANGRTFGVDFARRTSDTLRQLGFPNGITKNVGAKVVLTKDHEQISTIALGPGFLSTFTCYSYFGITS